MRKALAKFLRRNFLLVVGIVISLILIIQTFGGAKVIILTSQESVVVELRENGEAFVQEKRELELTLGINEVNFGWEKARVNPDSVKICFLEEPEKVSILREISFLNQVSSLIWEIDSVKEGKELVGISYLLSGWISYDQYQAKVNEGEDKISLEAYFIIYNQSGEDFRKVNIFSEDKTHWQTDIKNGEGKKLPHFKAENISLQKIYIFDREEWGDKVALLYQFFNGTDSPLNRDFIPSGRVRIYRKKGEELSFLGEDEIKKTASNQALRIYVGKVQDIQIRKEMLKFKKINIKRNDRGNIQVYDTEEEYEIILKNLKDKEVKVEVREHIPDSWEMLISEPKDYIKEDAHLIKYEIKIPPEEERKIHYQITRKNLLPHQVIKPLIYE